MRHILILERMQILISNHLDLLPVLDLIELEDICLVVN